VLTGFVTGGAEATVLPIPPDLAPGTVFHAQFWIADASATLGASASNTLRVTVQEAGI
jgi:membrane protein YqaA with SNARE-associated domain